MTDKMDVRNLCETDIIPMVRICNQTFLEGARFPGTARRAIEGLTSSPEWQWGIFEGDQLAGFLIGGFREEKRKANIWLIGIHPAFKGKGLGCRLISAMEEKSRESGAEFISVGTPFARGFYEKNGFACAKVEIRVVKDITQKVISSPKGCSRISLGFEEAQLTIPDLNGLEEKAQFLRAFLLNYEEHASLFYLIEKDQKAAAVILGRRHERCPDFAEVTFFRLLDNSCREAAVRAFEAEVSKMGLRYIGFQIASSDEEAFSKIGYCRSEMDFYWTMYTLKKQL